MKPEVQKAKTREKIINGAETKAEIEKKEPGVVEKTEIADSADGIPFELVIENTIIPDPEEDVVALYKTDFKKLSGPRVVGKIDLPVEEKKNHLPSSLSK